MDEIRGIHNTKCILQCVQIGQKGRYSYQRKGSKPVYGGVCVKMERSISNQPGLAERVEGHALDEVGQRLYERNFESLHIDSSEKVQQLIAESADAVESHKFSLPFLASEWEQVVDAWQLDSWPAYRNVRRLGRKKRLPEKQSELLWAIFEPVRLDC